MRFKATRGIIANPTPEGRFGQLGQVQCRPPVTFHGYVTARSVHGPAMSLAQRHGLVHDCTIGPRSTVPPRACGVLSILADLD